MPRLGSTIPLVARSAELETLRDALRRAEQGSGTAVLLSGDAGVGKSRLIQELSAHATTARALVLVGRCVDLGESGLPYLPFVEALGQLGPSRPERLRARPALARLLPGQPIPDAPQSTPLTAPGLGFGRALEQDLGQLQLFDAVTGLLDELAAQSCVVLVVEDLHWADSSTRDLLALLVARLGAQRLLLVGSYRAEELHRRHPLRPMLAELIRRSPVQRLELAPLAEADTATLVSTLAEGTLPTQRLEAIVRRSEGNAFFAEELLAASRQGQERVPAGLADVLLARIEALPAVAQATVRLAAAAQRGVSHEQLAFAGAVLGIDVEEGIRIAVQHNVLLVDASTEVYSFRHALVQEAVYHDLLPGERVRAHTAYADFARTKLGGPGSAAALAYHARQSHDLPTALAASVSAATEAEDRGAPAEALDHTERALALFSAVAPAQRPDGLTEMDLTRGASVLAGAAGQQERSLTFARSAVAMIDSDTDPEEAATSLRRLVIALAVFDGTADERGELIARAWQLVAELPASGRRAWVLAVRASTVRRTDPEQAAESARMAIADAATAGAAAAMSDALVTLGLVEDRAGHVEQAEGHLRAAIAPARQAGAVNTELRAHFFLGLHELDLGRLPAALRALQQGNRRARETGLRWCVYGLELRTVSMVAHFVAGEWDEVAELMADRPPRSDTVTARVSATGLGVLVGRGRFTECEALLRQLREHWHLDGTIAVSAGTEGAVSALWQGDAARAEARIAELLEFVDAEDDQVHLSTIRIAAIGLIAAAEVSATDAQDRGVVQRRADALMARVRHTVEKASPAGATLGPEARAWIAVATAAHQQCHGGDAVAGWAAAVDAFDYGDDYQQACARLRLAGLLLTGGMPERARDQLVAALQVAERVGAEPLREAITALAGRARLSLPGKEQAGKQRRRSTGDEVFTPRELAVLRLVAGGQTNRAVGEALFISEKTVSVHLSRVMAKLGARRRAEAVAIAIQRRLLDP